MIPEEKTAAVHRALQEAFGVAEFTDICLLARSVTALVFRIHVQGSPFLLRIITRIRDASVEGHFIAMRAAAEAGLAPRVWCTSLPDRVCITDFVRAVPFPEPEALTRLPAVLRTLHALPQFPPREPHLNTSCTFLLRGAAATGELIRNFRAAPSIPEAEKTELLARLAEISAIYHPAPEDLVPSHNDLIRPPNVLFDGDRVWLIDWEAAAPNDRYADLAVLANFLVHDDAAESSFLRGYLGRPPNEHHSARLFLMRQVAHIFYSMVYLLLGSSGQPVDPASDLPGFHEFHRQIWTGQIDLSNPRIKTVYGQILWRQLQQNLQQPRFVDSVRILSKTRPPDPLSSIISTT